VETVARDVRRAGLRLGFGGVGRPSDASLPIQPDLVYPQYPRLGATAAWLARSFYSGLTSREIPGAVSELRARLDYWFAQPSGILENQAARLAAKLGQIRENRS
jgi:hypothetical protein